MKVENDGPKNGINENGHKKVLSISIVFSINDVIDDVLADGKGLMSYSISHKQKQKGNFNKHQSVNTKLRTACIFYAARVFILWLKVKFHKIFAGGIQLWNPHTL